MSFGDDTLDPNNQIQKKQPAERLYQRQTVLIDEVRELQIKCPHTLKQITPNVITCPECGAMWIK